MQLTSCEYGGDLRESVYLRPGDKVHVSIYGDGSCRRVANCNHTGFPAYNELMNAPIITPEVSWIYRQFDNGAYDNKKYAQYVQRANEGYAKALEMVNYVCWHYDFCPFESALYSERIRARYTNLLTMLALNEESAGGSVDYSYLRNIDPDNMAFTLIPTEHLMPAMIVQLRPFSKCHQLVFGNEPDRWLKVINLQQQEFERLTGKSGYPFLFQMMIVEDYPSVFGWKPADERLYQQVRELLTNTYCKKRLDIIHQELLNK